MKCKEARYLMDEVIDGSLPSVLRRDFNRHLKQCPSCRSWLAIEMKEAEVLSKALRDVEAACALPSHEEMVKRLVSLGVSPVCRQKKVGGLPRGVKVAAGLAAMVSMALYAAVKIMQPAGTPSGEVEEQAMQEADVSDAAMEFQESGQPDVGNSLKRSQKANRVMSGAGMLTSEPITVRYFDDADVWQTAHGETALVWRWPTDAVEALLSTTSHMARTTSSLVVSRNAGETWGQYENVFPPSPQEMLYSVSITYRAQGGSFITNHFARVAVLPDRINVLKSGTKAWAKTGQNPRLLKCVASAEYEAELPGGATLPLPYLGKAGWEVFDPRSLGSYRGWFTLAFVSPNVSAELYRGYVGFMVNIQ